MEAALGWFGAIFQWLGRFMPRWKLVRRGWQAVKWLPGGRTKIMRPGIVWWWPVTSELSPYPVVRQVLNSNSQTLMTKDGKPVFASGIITYTIVNLHLFGVENYDAIDAIDDVLQTAIRRMIVSRTVQEIQSGRASVDNLLRREAQKALTSYGIKVESAKLTDFAPTRVLNLVGMQTFTQPSA